MTRAEKYVQAKALRDRGLKLREIGTIMGLAVQTISDLLVDPTGEKVRARKDRYRTPCIDCGTLTNPHGRKTVERCPACAHEFKKRASRKWILDSFREWADLHGGVPPTVADWSLAHARQQGQLQKVAHHQELGRPWPSQSLVASIFGSWNAGVRAAGFEPFLQGCYGRDGEYDHEPAA